MTHKTGRKNSFICLHHPIPQAAMPKPRKNSPSRKGPPHQERQGEWLTFQPSRALHEGLPWVSPYPETSKKVNVERARQEQEEKQRLPIPPSGNDHTSQWPALQMIPAAFATKKPTTTKDPLQISLVFIYRFFCSQTPDVWVLSCSLSRLIPPPLTWAQDLPGNQPQPLWLCKCKKLTNLLKQANLGSGW